MTKSKKAAPAAKSASSETEQKAASGLPLFFRKPAALDSERHKQAGLVRKADLSFARECNSVPLNAIEFLEAAHHYPIVFTNDAEPVPAAILSWSQTNPYITKTNEWAEGKYIPAYVRQYPFILYQAPNTDKYYLCIDEASSSYQAEVKSGDKDTLPLYEDGKPSAATNRALEFANAFFQHVKITRTFCDDLKKHDLLAPYNATATVDGKQQHLQGFLMINEKAFNALSDEVFLDFRKKGWLPFIYLSLASAANWKRVMDQTQQAAA